MIYVALGVVVLALFVGLGRGTLARNTHWRLLAGAMALAAVGGGVFDALRGAWIDTLLLLGAAAWLGYSVRQPRAPAASPGDSMSRAEALATLGVTSSAGREEIEAAYRRLMRRVHPDQGGATGLAARLNAAREMLLQR
ncbi:MAG: DnaJ domain-containing protein [Caulobacterales bacterium]